MRRKAQGKQEQRGITCGQQEESVEQAENSRSTGGELQEKGGRTAGEQKENKRGVNGGRTGEEQEDSTRRARGKYKENWKNRSQTGGEQE